MAADNLQKIVTETSIHYTPKAEQLLPYYKYKCHEPYCIATFNNVGNFEMHLQRHHNIPPPPPTVKHKLYHCPGEDCIYHYAKFPHGKHFKNMKYVRQHYQKVHAERPYICASCRKRFTTEMQLEKHVKLHCGKRLACSVCGWDYETQEALQTHAKRKGHVQEIPNSENEEQVEEPASFETCISDTKPPQNVDEPTTSKRSRTETVTGCDASAQTDLDMLPTTATAATNTTTESTDFINDIHSLTLLRTIETQTEFSPPKLPVTIAKTASSTSCDQMLAAGEATHMHTQTSCDAYLSELGLADIQTQTTEADDGAGYAHDELLVSTETQTSFTQCLLDSCPAEADGGAFGSLYTNTQHTQTCDTLLNGLFGAQEQDLIGGFQSSYTQT